MSKHFLLNIEQETIRNADYRRVLFTTHRLQLVVMSLKPGEEIGNECHGLDQFIRIEQGKAKAVIDNGGSTEELSADTAVIIPAGTWHNIVNIGDDDLKLYTIYTPPEHQKDVVQRTKADEAEEHFDGHTSLT